ncbi:MAG: hypothetical protein JWQ01_4833 [Massilia sp.]|nr:hypothetical protein [Massilia sp.]
MNITDQIQADKDLIEQHGGPTKLAEELGYDTTTGGAQRVHNWMTRGIPPRVKLARPDLFMQLPKPASRRKASPDSR